MTLKHLFIILSMIGFAATAHANDSEFFADGSHLIPLRQTNISVTKEVLKIKLCNDDYAEVDVYYEFYNNAKAHTILMGFEANAPYHQETNDPKELVKGNIYIENFTVTLNGKSIPHKVALVELNKTVDENGNIKPIDWNVWETSDEDYGSTLQRRKLTNSDDDYIQTAYAYYFDAPFLQGKNVLHHHYRYKMSGGVGMAYSLEYKLSPATRWANGQIDDFTLEISAEKDAIRSFALSADNPFKGITPTFRGVGKISNGAIAYLDRQGVFLRGGTVVYHAKNFKPKTELYISADHTIFMSSYDNESQLLSYIKSMTYTPNRLIAFNSIDYAEAKFTVSAATRKIIHNIPYAVRGHVFKNPALASFFKQCWWYIPDPTGKTEQTIRFTHEENMLIKEY